MYFCDYEFGPHSNRMLSEEFRINLLSRDLSHYDLIEAACKSALVHRTQWRMSFQMSTQKQRILFLCTGNCIRSQMAEGWLRYLAEDRCESLSAGASPAGFIHKHAVTVMKEAGIDVSRQRSKSIQEFMPPEGIPPDMVISVCDSASQKCPIFPAHVERLHWPFDDPYYSECEGDELINEFRRVRDEIRTAIEEGIKNGVLRLI